MAWRSRFRFRSTRGSSPRVAARIKRATQGHYHQAIDAGRSILPEGFNIPRSLSLSVFPPSFKAITRMTIHHLRCVLIVAAWATMEDAPNFDAYGAFSTPVGSCSGGQHMVNATSGIDWIAYGGCKELGCRGCVLDDTWCTRFAVTFRRIADGDYAFRLTERCSCGFTSGVSKDSDRCRRCAYDDGCGYFYGCLLFCPSGGGGNEEDAHAVRARLETAP